MRDEILVMEQRPAEVFVTALISLGLLTVITKSNADDDCDKRKLYSNSEIADLFLDKNKPSYIGENFLYL